MNPELGSTVGEWCGVVQKTSFELLSVISACSLGLGRPPHLYLPETFPVFIPEVLSPEKP